MAVVDLQLLVQTLLYFCIFLSGFAISIPVGVNTVGKFFIVLYIIVNYDWWNHIYTTHIWDMCFILLSFFLLPFTSMFSSLFIMEYCKNWRYIVEDLVFYAVCCSFTCISCFDHCMFTFVLWKDVFSVGQSCIVPPNFVDFESLKSSLYYIITEIGIEKTCE